MAQRDLPHAHATYENAGHYATLLHTPDQSGRWEVFVGNEYIGVLFEIEPIEGEPGAHYRARLPGDEDDRGTDFADDWRDEVNFLIDAQFSAT
jgi:hypothetical protein